MRRHQREQRDDEQRQRDADGDLPFHAEGGDRRDHRDEQDQEERDGDELDLEADAHQRIGRQRADQDGEQRAGDRDDDGVPVGASVWFCSSMKSHACSDGVKSTNGM